MHAFFHAFNKANIEGIMAVYEPGALMVTRPGQVAEGQTALRDVFKGYLATKPTLTPEKYKIVTNGDLALLVIQWTLKGTGQDGKPLQSAGTSSDVMRRQPDGRWLFVIDNPWGAGTLGSTSG